MAAINRGTLNRQQLEQRLEDALMGKVISYDTPQGIAIAGKVQRLAVEFQGGDFIVIFQINHRRYESDIRYFIGNTQVHGNTHGGDPGYIRRVLQDDRSGSNGSHIQQPAKIPVSVPDQKHDQGNDEQCAG
jgi:hypothetical protein